MKFDQKTFLADVERVLNADYACDLKSAGRRELYNAVSKAVMEETYDDWSRERNAARRRCGYFSAEFLMGRAIYSNLLNLGILEDVGDALKSVGEDLNQFEEVEDAALGNGGLGRLAACYLESAASKNIALDGYGIRYRYGLFRQTFEDGFQHEEGDDWLRWGDPWSVRVERDAVLVKFADQTVRAVPYDMPIFGYRNGVVNTLRLWQAEPVQAFDFAYFNEMRGEVKANENFNATKITDVLYPNDNTMVGKILRLRQQYFMVSASLQDIVKKFKASGKDLRSLPEKWCFQLNDTHPVIAIPELLRILQTEGLTFEEAFGVCAQCFNFTNHTIMAEALEKWDALAFSDLLPDVYEQIVACQQRLQSEGLDPNSFYIVRDNVVHMANLAIYVSAHVNGVAEIHTNILRTQTFRNWYERYPEKFVNITNGITPRRWLLLNNPEMARLIDGKIGDGWHTDLPQLKKLTPFLDGMLPAFVRIKRENKKKLAAYISEHEGVDLSPDFIFDVQVKRLHEYKRQMLNALSVLWYYFGIKDGEITDFPPTAFIFGAKAAPGYYLAKAIIKFINEVAKLVNGDPAVADKMKVVFVQNYNVSYAEKIVCAADISEQISLAGMEASGTSNMKFMLNGTVTLGTMDGANVEICEEAGRENNYIFGATVEEVAAIKQYYCPREIVEQNPRLKRALETLVDGTFSDGSGMLRKLYESLLTGYEPDRYLVLYDFADYVRVKTQLLYDFGTDEFNKKCLVNMANVGKFSADRSVSDYAKQIWNL
ncbi:MAG TPA: glycogen/starch/alpha-glucan phosphorylase [Firmicutes bacterium]|nr:glycogen/starch/alpha-glucan phosphorylase [Bacillota bacterium]